MSALDCRTVQQSVLAPLPIAPQLSPTYQGNGFKAEVTFCCVLYHNENNALHSFFFCKYIFCFFFPLTSLQLCTLLFQLNHFMFHNQHLSFVTLNICLQLSTYFETFFSGGVQGFTATQWIIAVVALLEQNRLKSKKAYVHKDVYYQPVS